VDDAEDRLGRIAADIEVMTSQPGPRTDAALRARLEACSEEVARLRRDLDDRAPAGESL
jgi:hypothetical protein